MSEPYGLIFCVNDWSDTFCVTKTIQFLVSFTIFLFLIHDFTIRFCKERQLNFFFVVHMEMMAALLDHRIRPMMYIESYAYNIYFTTIVYQVSRRLAQLKKGSQHFKLIWYSVHSLLIFFFIFLTITLIVRLVITYNECEEVWFLIINMFGILLSILMVLAGKFYTKVQAEKIQGMIQKNTKNPLPEVWKWIIINIVCQFFLFLRSFIYMVLPYDCSFSGSYSANQILGLIFDVFSFHIGMISTIIFFRKKSIQDDNSSKQYSSTARERICTGYSKEIELQSTVSKIKKNMLNPKSKQVQQIQHQRLTAKMFLDAGGAQRFTLTQNKMPIFSI